MPGMMKQWSHGMGGEGGQGGASGGGGASGSGGGQSAAPASGSSKAAASGSGGGASGNAVIDEVNRVRAQYGLSPLTADASLSADSAQNDQANVSTGNLAHHFDFGTAEVTGYESGGATPQSIVQGWLNSPGHREIILGDYTRIGADITGQYATADLS